MGYVQNYTSIIFFLQLHCKSTRRLRTSKIIPSKITKGFLENMSTILHHMQLKYNSFLCISYSNLCCTYFKYLVASTCLFNMNFSAIYVVHGFHWLLDLQWLLNLLNCEVYLTNFIFVFLKNKDGSFSSFECQRTYSWLEVKYQ